jgi:hypothetical protein
LGIRALSVGTLSKRKSGIKSRMNYPKGTSH